MADRGGDGDYSVALGALRYCHTIRNTYAHCNWASHSDAGLFYADLEDAAQGSIYRPYKWLHIDIPVLERLESFYGNTHDWMLFIHSEAIFLKGFGNHNPIAKPRALLRPTLHNPPETHARPLTYEDRISRHARLAREAEEAFRLSQQKHDLEKPPPPVASG
jgi:hypothetical protein